MYRFLPPSAASTEQTVQWVSSCILPNRVAGSPFAPSGVFSPARRPRGFSFLVDKDPDDKRHEPVGDSHQARLGFAKDGSAGVIDPSR
jgi:hypothetical protein